MKLQTFLISLAFLLFDLSGWAASEGGPTPVPSKFAREVEKFAALARSEPGGILLVGSSIFKRWTNAVSDLAPLPVSNRAFGGSQTSHQLMFFDQVVPPCHAGLIVWYCGSNDIKGKKEPSSVLERTEEWLTKVAQSDPSVRVLLVSVIRSPQKRRDGQLEAVDSVNHGYEEFSKKKERVFYVDVNPVLETPAGEAKAELYVEDGLHFNIEGYQQMTTLLKPAIERYWKRKPNP